MKNKPVAVKPTAKKPANAAAEIPQKKPALSDRQVLILHLSILAVVFFFTYVNIYDPKINLNGDNIYYYILGKSIATGHGYSNIFSPSMEPHNHFAPGFPFILSLFMRLGIYDMDFCNYLNGVITLGSIFIFYLLVKKISGDRRLGFAAALLMMMNVLIMNYASITMSEAPYMFFSLLSLYCLIMCDMEKPFYKNLTFLVLVAAVIMAYYIRSSGAILCLSIAFYFVIKKKWLYAGTLLLIFGLSVLPWYLRTQSLGGDFYMKQLLLKNPYDGTLGNATFGDFLERIGVNIKRYVSVVIPNSMFPGVYDIVDDLHPPIWFWLSGIAYLAIIGYAMVRLVKKYPSVVIYFAASMCLLMVWPPQWKDLRFTVPYIPFLLLFLLVGANYLVTDFLKKRQIGWNPYFFSLTVLLTFPFVMNMTNHKDEPYMEVYKTFFDMAEWCKDHIPPNTVVCCRKPEFFYFFSGHPSVSYSFTKDDKQLLRDLTKNKVDYVVVDPLPFSSARLYLTPALDRNKDKFDMVHMINPPNATPNAFLLKYKR